MPQPPKTIVTKQYAPKSDEDELDHHWDHAHVWDEEVEGPEDLKRLSGVFFPTRVLGF